MTQLIRYEYSNKKLFFLNIKIMNFLMTTKLNYDFESVFQTSIVKLLIQNRNFFSKIDCQVENLEFVTFNLKSKIYKDFKTLNLYDIFCGYLNKNNEGKFCSKIGNILTFNSKFCIFLTLKFKCCNFCDF